MRTTTFVVAIASALALAGARSAAAAAPDPVKHALQRSDLPAKIYPSADARPLHAYEIEDLGVSGLKAAGYSYSWPAGGVTGGMNRTWYLFGYVFVAPNEAGAKQLYQSAIKLHFGLPPFVEIRYPPRHQAVLNLPSYGNEQLGIVGEGEGTEATLYVRRGTVLWALSISHGPTAWKPTKAQVLTELKLYAHKQAARVGAG